MTNPDSLSIRIFDYTDFRLYLKDYYLARKAVDKRFSHRFIHLAVGASSSGWFSDLLQGRITLTGVYLFKLTKLLGLKQREESYFEALVAFNQAGSLDEKNRGFRKILSFREVKPEMVGREKFEFYSKWYYAVVRELLFFESFSGDFATLAKKLKPAIKPSEAKKAIELLKQLDFISQGQDGSFRARSGALKKDPDSKFDSLANFLKAHMELAMQALETYPKEQRDVSTLTLSLSQTGFIKAQEEIRALRKRLLALTNEDPIPEKVYQCNFQIFPVTE